MSNCYICGSDKAVQTHHVLMQSAGGKEGPIVLLCASCHDASHAYAANLESKNPTMPNPFTPKEWLKAKRIVEYIILSIRKNKNAPDANDPAKLIISLTKKEIYLLHLIKKDKGQTNLNTYITSLIKGMIKSHFPSY